MKKAVVLTMILAIGLMSCTKQENLNRSDEKVALSVKAGISITPSTKAIINGEKFSNGAEIGIQVLNTSDAVYETGASTNVKFTASVSGEVTTWSTATTYYLTATQGRIYGYYPYAESVTNLGVSATIPVTLQATANAGSETDYMYATPITAIDNLVSNASGKNTANLNMKHSLAQVSFVVYKENYGGTGNLSEFKLEDAASTNWILVSDVTPITMNIANGAINGGAKGIITRTLSPAVSLPASAAGLPSADPSTLRTQVNATTLVVPTTGMTAGDIKFTFTIDGKASSVLTNKAIAWEAGKQYIYKVKLSGTELSISNVTITDWNPVAGDDVNIK